MCLPARAFIRGASFRAIVVHPLQGLPTTRSHRCMTGLEVPEIIARGFMGLVACGASCFTQPRR
eukprot:7616706-Pyramimonas_sp.AAC.1